MKVLAYKLFRKNRSVTQLRFGKRTKGGERTNEECAVIGVIEKKPPEEVAEPDLLPRYYEGKLSNGKHYRAPTDVIQASFVQADSDIVVRSGSEWRSAGLAILCVLL